MTMFNFALDVARIATGTFFVFSGYHKLTNPDRRAALCATLKSCGVPFIGFMQWWVPGWEFAGGLMVASGWWPVTIVGSLALTVICLIACMTDGRKRVAGYKPIDLADRVDDVLYLPEFLYIILLFVAFSRAVEQSGVMG